MGRLPKEFFLIMVEARKIVLKKKKKILIIKKIIIVSRNYLKNIQGFFFYWWRVLLLDCIYYKILKNLLDVQLEDAGFLECEVVEAMREYGQIIGKDIEAKQSVPIRIRGRFCLF